jgi:sulfoxide reductase heme-binding subunit YedZ
VYVAAGLGCWHYWWQVKRDVRDPMLYAAVFAALMIWRLWQARQRAAARAAAATAASVE